MVRTIVNLRIILVVIFCGCSISANSLAQEPRRVALVIGNSDYKVGALRNPANDADSVETALIKLGFEVIKRKDRSKIEMERDIDEATKGLREDDMILFFYAGHGQSVDETNYLIPINAVIEREHHISERCVNTSYLRAALENSDANLKVIVLDCCRNNPFRTFVRSNSVGLAKMPAIEGTIIVFSTKPGSVALDGEGANSPFAKHMVKTINDDHPLGLTVEGLFNKTAIAVKKETSQRGYCEHDNSMEEFFLIQPRFFPQPEEGKLNTKESTAAKDDAHDDHDSHDDHDPSLQPEKKAEKTRPASKSLTREQIVRMLVGNWKMISGRGIGVKRLPPRVEITPQTFSMPTQSGPNPNPIVMTYVIDASASPIAIDFQIFAGPQPKGKIAKGIITMSEDNSKISLIYDPNNRARPTRFQATRSNGFHRFDLKREK